LLATPTVNAPTNTPSSGPSHRAPSLLPPIASAPANNIHPASILCARNRIINASGATINAMNSVQDGSKTGFMMCGLPNVASADLASQRYAKTNRQNRTSAPLKRAVPETRLRVDNSSWLQSTSIRINTIKPASVALDTANGPIKNVSPPQSTTPSKPRSVQISCQTRFCACASRESKPMNSPIPADTAISRNPHQEIWMPLPKKDQRRVQ